MKDLNSLSGTFVHDCRVQNAAVRLADGDSIRFGYNGIPLEFRIEQQQQQQQQQEVLINVLLILTSLHILSFEIQTTMPSIYPRTQANNSLHVITQTIPSRKTASTMSNYPQQLDVRQNPGFSLRSVDMTIELSRKIFFSMNNRSRPVSAGAKKPVGVPVSNHVMHESRDHHPRGRFY